MRVHLQVFSGRAITKFNISSSVYPYSSPAHGLLKVSAMLRHSVLIIHHDIIEANNHSHRRMINEIVLISCNHISIEWVRSHSLESLHSRNPKLRSAVEFKHWSSARDAKKVSKFRSRVVLQNKLAYMTSCGIGLPTCEYLYTPNRK